MRTFRIYCVALAALCFAGSISAQPYCDQQTVTGVYALAYQGTMFLPVPGTSQAAPLPGAGLAIVSIDSQGAISSFGYQTVGGVMSYAPAMPGIIKVTSNCTGTVAWTGGATATIVIADGGDEMHSLVLQSPLGTVVVDGTWKRIARLPANVSPSPCSASSVFGTYAIWQRGYVMATLSGSSQPSPVPGALAGTAIVTRDGAIEGSGTVVLGGQALPYGSATGTIQLKADCSGTVTFTAVSQGRSLGPVQEWVVVLDGGDTLWTIELSTPMGKPVTLGVMKRISYTIAGQ